MDVANEIPPWTLRVLPCHAPRTPWGWFPWRPQECAELERTCWLADAGRVREDAGGGQGPGSRVAAHGTNLKTFLLRVRSVICFTNTARPPPVPCSRSLGLDSCSRKLACACPQLISHTTGEARLKSDLLSEAFPDHS